MWTTATEFASKNIEEINREEEEDEFIITF